MSGISALQSHFHGLVRLRVSARLGRLCGPAILEDWLSTRSLAPQKLAERFRGAPTTMEAEPIELEADELAALAELMATADVGDYAGLALLKSTLRGL